MEKLMKPAEYAQELGISRQAVYAKVKRGILRTKNVEGKLYIVVDTMTQEEVPQMTKETVDTSDITPIVQKNNPVTKTEVKDYKALLRAKDETIAVLKGTVKDLKKSNKQISTTLRGEIDLLKDAFHEMRSLYVRQLEYKKAQESAIDVSTEENQEPKEERWIGLKKFFKFQHITAGNQEDKIAKRFKKAYKSGDERLRKIDGKLKLDASKNYGDILN